MQIREKKYNYLDENQLFTFKESLDNGVRINMFVLLESEKFLDYQKDLLQDFLAELIDKSNGEVYDEGELKTNLEVLLQQLNEKLKIFAEKVTDVNRFTIKGYIQIVAGNSLISSMIGDTSIVIFRDFRLYYKSYNNPSKKDKIDLFSGFIEGDVESGDEIIYVGTKVSDILDQGDIDEMERLLAEEESEFMNFFEQTITSRANKDSIGYISDFYIHGNIEGVLDEKKLSFLKKGPKRGKIKLNTNWGKDILKNKYYVIILVLSVVILYMLYGVLSQILKTGQENTFLTESGTRVDITIDDIKKDIFAFQQMDASSDEKGVKYNEIIEKLTILEEKGKWIEDVENLKGIVEDNYYEGFNIDRIQDMSAFDDPATGIKSRVLTLNNTEKSKLGDLMFIDYHSVLYIGGQDGALVGATNDSSRGGLVEYGIDSDIAGCSSNLLKDGIYCFTKDGRIFNITKAGIEPLTTMSEGGFPDTVGAIGTYGKSNLYVFQPSLNSSLNGVFVTRYRNTVGSEVSYQAGQNYTLTEGSGTGYNSMTFGDVAIDSTFLTWSSGALYQLWRPGYGSSLEIRQVKLLGGDSINNKYSDDVKVIASLNSKYVFLFDRENKTFTVYTSSPLKTNDAYNTQFSLNYLFSFKFDLKSETVVDVAIPDAGGNKPEMYILTTVGVNKIPLYDYIASVEKDDVLKATTNNNLTE